jgi:hypothetical protein
MNLTKKSAILLGCLGLIVGVAGTAALQSYAATTNSTTTSETSTVTAPNTSSTTDTETTEKEQTKIENHAPLGGDGNITAINGNTITMTEEANEGGASYTVDASNAAIMNNGSPGTISDLKAGDKVFVQGTVSGTNVAATSISLGKGKGMGHAPLGGDGNITAINDNTITMTEEANEGGASYTIDASKANVTNNGAQASVSDLKVGDKIFVQGTTNGNNVTATSISLGHPGERGYYNR